MNHPETSFKRRKERIDAMTPEELEAELVRVRQAIRHFRDVVPRLRAIVKRQSYDQWDPMV